MFKAKNTNNFISNLLIAVPLLFYWGYATYVSFDYPYQYADPEYAYFLASLAPFKGVGYSYVDHPGTPVEVIGSVLLGITYPLVTNISSVGFIQFHFNDPRLFFLITDVFLLVASIMCAVYFYHTAIKEQTWENILIAVSLALMFYALRPSAFTTLKYWSHNSFNFPFGTLVLLFLYRVVQTKGEISRRNIFILGFGSGILTSVVIYFGTWILGITITIWIFYRAQGLPLKKTGSDLTTFGGACVTGFVLGVLPIINKISKFTKWIFNLITHQGKYGHGEYGITSMPLLYSNYLTMLQENKFLFLFTGLTFILLISAILLRGREVFSRKPGLTALGIGLSFQIAASTIIIAKHHTELYVFSIAAAAPVLALTVKELFDEFPFPSKILNLALIFVILIGIIPNLMNSILEIDRSVFFTQRLNNDISHVINDRAAATRRRVDEVVILWAYEVWPNTPCNTLGRMNNYYIHGFADELAKVCVNQYFIASEFGQKPIASSLFEYNKQRPKQVGINELKWDFIVIPDKNLKLLSSRLLSKVSIKSLPNTPGISIIYPETVQPNH